MALARASLKITAAPAKVARVSAKAQNKAASFAAGAAASVLLAATPAFAASVKLGSDSGGVVFDADAVPDGVDVDSLSSYDLLNAPGESHSATFDVAGTYEYYCEPHQGAGMAGKVVVN